MKNLYFASNNSHKVEEVQAILAQSTTWRIKGLAELELHEEIPETGNTLQANALIKAQFLNDHFGVDCFADDTGLEVEALDGAPGVYSARYAGEPSNSQANIDKLLLSLQGNDNRKAQFRTVIALIEQGTPRFFEGCVKGTIAHARRGEGGFGYDPIFIPEGYDRSFAELSSQEKNSISHRALAVNQLCEYLKNKDNICL